MKGTHESYCETLDLRYGPNAIGHQHSAHGTPSAQTHIFETTVMLGCLELRNLSAASSLCGR